MKDEKEHTVKDEKELMADPWKHRTTGLACRSCMWYVPKVAAPLPELKTTAVAIGRCRRHSPTMAGYPVVYPADWCGDHKLDETKATQ